jgi:hypothetical protein
MATNYKVTQTKVNLPDGSFDKRIFINGVKIATHSKFPRLYGKNFDKTKKFHDFNWCSHGLDEVLGDKAQALVDATPYEHHDNLTGVTGEFYTMKEIKAVLESGYYD